MPATLRGSAVGAGQSAGGAQAAGPATPEGRAPPSAAAAAGTEGLERETARPRDRGRERGRRERETESARDSGRESESEALRSAPFSERPRSGGRRQYAARPRALEASQRPRLCRPLAPRLLCLGGGPPRYSANAPPVRLSPAARRQLVRLSRQLIAEPKKKRAPPARAPLLRISLPSAPPTGASAVSAPGAAAVAVAVVFASHRYQTAFAGD